MSSSLYKGRLKTCRQPDKTHRLQNRFSIKASLELFQHVSALLKEQSLEKNNCCVQDRCWLHTSYERQRRKERFSVGRRNQYFGWPRDESRVLSWKRLKVPSSLYRRVLSGELSQTLRWNKDWRSKWTFHAGGNGAGLILRFSVSISDLLSPCRYLPNRISRGSETKLISPMWLSATLLPFLIVAPLIRMPSFAWRRRNSTCVSVKSSVCLSTAY